MSEKLCFGCMRTREEGESVCPVCGYRHDETGSIEYALKPGMLLQNGKYLVGRVLGKGGFGITYIALEQQLGMKVAIKEFYPQGQVVRNLDGSSIFWHSTEQEVTSGKENFLKEARKMAKLHSIPGIVQVREVFYENNTAYIVMDYVEGETLKTILKESGLMKAEDCVGLLTPIMQSLNRAHGMGMIHRDISPDNIMIDHMGQPWLLDMGAAKDLDSSGEHSMSSNAVVKRGFSPPEQYFDKKNIGPWTDVYAMSATIYYCLTGKLVPESIERALDDTLSFPDGFSPRVEAALRKGLAIQAKERIQTMGELQAELAKAVTPKAAKPAEKKPKPKPVFTNN